MEILIATLLICWIEGRVVGITGAFAHLMKVRGIFFEQVVGGKVLAASKPLGAYIAVGIV